MTESGFCVIYALKTLLLRLDMKADSIMHDWEAFDDGEMSIQPPSDAA
jgi:hypothetical protein